VGAVPLVAGGTVPVVDLTVDTVAVGTELPKPWAPMVGSERLSQLLCTDRTGGHEIGAELEQALRRMHDELGVRTVRAHAIFHDDTHVFGPSGYDFSVVDAIYDKLLAIGLRPVVELGFMPRELASDPSKTVFEYGAIFLT
jgi:xylan 1,4-beta-xylosidase